MTTGYPVGKAQQQVLDALGLKAETFEKAEQIFQEIGIIVSSRRAGRNSVPVVTRMDDNGGGFNAFGEGETWKNDFAVTDFDKINQWMS